MANPAQPEKKPAPPRNNLNRHGLYRESQKLRGQDPRYIYKCFVVDDPKHPSFLGKKVDEHEVGSQLGGFAMAPGWEVVQRSTDKDAHFAQPRDDQGKGVDTRVRYGAQVLCRMLKTDYDASYGATENAHQKEIEKNFYTGEKVTFDRDGHRGSATVASVLTDDPYGGEAALDEVRSQVRPQMR